MWNFCLKIRKINCLVLFSLLFSPTSVHAQSISSTDLSQGYLLKAGPLSFGGAFRALADTNAAILYNPAGLAQRKEIVAMGGDYLRNGLTEANTFGVSIVDTNAIDFISVGLSYDRDMPTIGGIDATIQQITLAVAHEFSPLFYLGASIKGYLTNIETVGGPDGVDMDVGLLVKPLPMVSLAFVAHNLAKGHDFEEFPFLLGFGAALDLRPHFRLSMDIVKDFKTPARNDLNAYFGSELRIVEGICFRGGFGLDKVRDNNFYSLGTAVAGPKIGLLFTFSQHLNPTSETYAASVEAYF